MALEDVIRDKIEKALQPKLLEIVNESHLHQGHAGDDGSGESHWRLVIVSDAFEGDSRVMRQRRVMGILAEEIKSNIHALSMQCKSPKEML